MSSTLDLANQTGLIPQNFYALDASGNNSVQITNLGALFTNNTISRNLGVGASGFLLNGTTIIDPLNLTAVCSNPTPNSLNVSNEVLIQSSKTSPNETILIQGADPSVVGQIFGINYNDSLGNDFTIQTAGGAGQGGVVFKEIGISASTGVAKIKQGVITSSNGTNTSTINPTSITTGTFIGDLSGNAVSSTNASNVAITDDNTNAIFYPVFVSNNTGNLPLKVDKTTNPLSYNPSTGAFTTQSYTATTGGSQISSLSNTNLQVINAGSATTTINSASITCNSGANTTTITPTSITTGTLNYTALSPAINLGMTLLSTNTLTAFTGASASLNQAFANIFNSSYANYRIIITATNPSAMGTNFPVWEITATSGTGTQPTAWYSYKETFTNTGASTGTLTYANSSVLPITLSGSNNSCRNLQFDIMNVGFAQNTAGGYATVIVPKQAYTNIGGNGWVQNTAECFFSSGVSMTGFTLQLTGSSGSVATNGSMKVYGYN